MSFSLSFFHFQFVVHLGGLVGGGGWLESELSDRLWLEPSLDQAKQLFLIPTQLMAEGLGVSHDYVHSFIQLCLSTPLPA